jgi:hypothetical protein
MNKLIKRAEKEGGNRKRRRKKERKEKKHSLSTPTESAKAQ